MSALNSGAFSDAFYSTLTHEGGYVNHPRDPGGETKYGISKRSYPHLDIKNLTTPQAKEIYYRDFWMEARCDDLPTAIRGAVFDFAVNSGVSRAIKTLQQVLSLPADGKVGPKTIHAANNYNGTVLAARYLGARLEFVADLKNFTHAGRGWARRIAKGLKNV